MSLERGCATTKRADVGLVRPMPTVPEVSEKSFAWTLFEAQYGWAFEALCDEGCLAALVKVAKRLGCEMTLSRVGHIFGPATGGLGQGLEDAITAQI